MVLAGYKRPAAELEDAEIVSLYRGICEWSEKQSDGLETGIATMCLASLISVTHDMNAQSHTIDVEQWTRRGEDMGDWRITIERVDRAIQLAEQEGQ